MDTFRILNGVDQVGSLQDELRYQRIALLTTGSALNRWMMPTLQFINERFNLQVLFGAEYGIMGEKRAGERYESYTDVWTNLPAFSLYRFGSSTISTEMLAKFDVLMIDLPLTGTRYCSYIQTMHSILRQLATTDKRIIILDRPNPLGGTRLDGPVLSVSLKQNEDDVILPNRFALTLGELANMINEEEQLGAHLEVLKTKEITREMTHLDFNKPWIVSQMHLPRFETCLLSVGLEVLRGTNLSLGLGTSLPFEVIGAPYLDAIQTSAALNKRNISGVIFSPIYFTPSSNIHQGIRCQGVQIHVTDITKVSPTRLMMEIVHEMVQVANDDFVFTKDRQGKYEIDYLFGNNRLRRQPEDYKVILDDASKELELFSQRIKPYLLYKTKAEIQAEKDALKAEAEAAKEGEAQKGQ